MTETTTLPIGAITVGERYRKELGDVESLARSIEEIGLLQPVVVTPGHRLIAGERRLAALRLLGRKEVPVTVIDLDDVLKGEYAENVERKDFVPSERVAIARAIEDLEREQARGRQGERNDLHPGKLSEGAKGDVRDIVAAAVGWSGRTYELARRVVVAAEQDPGAFGAIAEEMDRTGKVYPSYERLVRARDGVDKSREATKERLERIRTLFEEGHLPDQIAATVGMSDGGVRHALGNLGLSQAERFGKRRQLDIDRVMTELSTAVLEQMVELVLSSWDGLDRNRFNEWKEALACEIKQLQRIQRRLRTEQKG